jgi:hypothetical protein
MKKKLVLEKIQSEIADVVSERKAMKTTRANQILRTFLSSRLETLKWVLLLMQSKNENMPSKKSKTVKVVRNAKTGRFSKSKRAKQAPATHVTETISIPSKKKK